MYFNLHSVAGFKPIISGHKIYKKNNTGKYELFYIPNKRNFNLPVGSYYTIYGSISELNHPVKFERNILKPRTKYRFNIDDVDIRLKKNPNKASVLFSNGKGIIIFDEELYKRSSDPERVFMLLHEFGHSFYDSEFQCDKYAQNIMLDLGYNPSQILLSGFQLLGCNKHRFDSIYKDSEKWETIR